MPAEAAACCHGDRCTVKYTKNDDSAAADVAGVADVASRREKNVRQERDVSETLYTSFFAYINFISPSLHSVTNPKDPFPSSSPS